jgi:hypothetical protein
MHSTQAHKMARERGVGHERGRKGSIQDGLMGGGREGGREGGSEGGSSHTPVLLVHGQKRATHDDELHLLDVVTEASQLLHAVTCL